MNKRPVLPPRAAAKQKYDTARANLLLMTIFTIVNAVLLIVGSDTFFLFSATIPYLAFIEGMVYQILGQTHLEILSWAIAVALIAAYLVCWFFSGKRLGFMVGALVLFTVDTAYMAYTYLSMGALADSVIDILFHAFVLVYLVLGVINGYKLKTLPPDPVEEQGVAPAEGNLPPEQ